MIVVLPRMSAEYSLRTCDASAMKWSYRKQLSDLLSLLMPSACLLCAAKAQSGRGATQLCGACVDAMPVLGDVCQHCAEPVREGSDTCHHCEQQTPAFERVYAAFRYAWPLNILVTGFKFDGQYRVGDSLATLMAKRLAARGVTADLVVPVPLHPDRLASRGFNQAEVLSSAICVHLGLAEDTELLTRVTRTEPQSGKNRRQRLENLSGAFRVQRRLHGEHVALVDDVLTTGVTADRIASELLKAGAGRVSVWVLARTANE